MELKEVAAQRERAAALCDSPAMKAELSRLADESRSRADAM